MRREKTVFKVFSRRILLCLQKAVACNRKRPEANFTTVLRQKSLQSLFPLHELLYH